MTKYSPLCFEVYRKANLKADINNLLQENYHILSYETLLSSLVQICDRFVFSLRHLYTPSKSNSQNLKSFILLNPISQISDPNMLDRVEGLLKGSLSRFYGFTHQPKKFCSLDWVNSISEIVKFGKFVEEPEFVGYLPYFFSTELTNGNFNLSELLEDTSCEKLVLEFSLEAYNSSSEQAYWSNAINDLVSRISNCCSRSNSVEYALNLYKNYQDNYAENQLFKYSIKALGCKAVDTVKILQTLGVLAGSKSKRQNINSILTFNLDDANFVGSLEATKNVRVFQDIRWDGWEKKTGKNLEQKLIKETIKSGDLLSSLDDGSLIFPILPSNLDRFEKSQKKDYSLPGSSELRLDTDSTDSSDLVLAGSTPLSRIFEVQIPKVEHLKPLHHITTFQEVVGFVQVFSPTVSAQQNNFLVLSAKEIFAKYRHLITKDTYIVGLDDNENPIISSWAKIPHRLIAGLPGAGKTNFLNWVVFQFLYVNPNRRIYIADFGGVDFQHLNKLKLNVEIVDTPEGCPDLVEKIHHEEYERRLDLMKEHSVSDLKLLQREGVDIDRTLWIIDEAADIADVSIKLRDSIEKRLKEYARKGRKYGIHVLYCTQRPTTEVVTRQVTDQCEEKTVFRVTPDASQRILDDTVAGNIPKDARGRAWLDGDAGRMFVNVPKMEKPEGSTILIADTLWHYFLVR